MSKSVLGLGAILDGVLIAGTQYWGLSGNLHYLWALLAIVWGFVILSQKS